uniref:Integrase, catalytic region, zinc finger, CCHC-type, peptidase aspartic, catalytic n=1 Tax=Tanacetum cinerariifolium TaxID=118510 RepID=A0A699J9Z4_TANCI|nr:integrase, catalytic region, zinc finger, CCHC-type, peptidase aspartic, catalytic [Tanacetum cinerariifolium]
MTGNRALLTNFIEMFLGTVRFGNNDFTVIAGYGDVIIGSMTIKKVYYVEGLGHYLFSVGQFCDKGLEVAFRKSTCFVRNEDGVDLLTGDRSSNLYTIALNEVTSNSSTCLLAKASSSQSCVFDCNNARNGLCNARMDASVIVNDLFVFDDVSIRKSHVSKMSFRKKPSASLNVPSRSKLNKYLPRIVRKWLPKLQPLAEPVAKWIPRICLCIINSRCSKHMTGNCDLLRNFVENFLGTVRFGNNDFAVIAGYGDVVIGSMTIKKVYYVEGLGHNLFSVGQFCDKGLEVPFESLHALFKTKVLVVVDDYSRYTWGIAKVANVVLRCEFNLDCSIEVGDDE